MNRCSLVRPKVLQEWRDPLPEVSRYFATQWNGTVTTENCDRLHHHHPDFGYRFSVWPH